MIVLDTNVISEMMKPIPAPVVELWLASQPSDTIVTTAVTQAEILFGLQLLPDGRRRRDLDAAIRAFFDIDLFGRILSFDDRAAVIYADIASSRRLSGHPISQFDAQIAAIAISRGAAIATRNVVDFHDIGVAIIDPWNA